MFGHPDFDQHERLIFINDEPSKLRAIIAIHSLALGPALGGCRMRPYESEQAAITDVLRLSRAMSYKNALGDRSFGGAKAVIIGDPVAAKTPELLHAFGRAVHKIGGDYVTAEDAGIGPDDIGEIATSTTFVRNIDHDRGGPAPYTAYGMYIAIRTATDQILGRGLRGASISIQGLGNVGLDLAARLHKDGARLLVSDIDPAKTALAATEFNATIVSSEDAHKQEVDVFSPSAFGGILNSETIPHIQAPIIAGAANNQLASIADDEALARRNIVYCPDYVVNAGGIRSTETQGLRFDHGRAMRRVEGIEQVLASIISSARSSGRGSSAVADEMAQHRIGRA